MRQVQAPKQVWKLGEGEEVLPDGSVLCPGSRRPDGSYRKATRRKKGYYNDEDMQRNVYKPNPVRMREAGFKHVVGLGMVQNNDGRNKEITQEKKDEKRRKNVLKTSLKHTLLHLVRPFCIENEQPDRFFAYRVIENMCKRRDASAIESLAKQDWQTELFDNFEKAVAEINNADFKTRRKQAMRYLHRLLHEIECWKIRQQGGVDLNKFWLQDIQDQAEFEAESKRFDTQKAEVKGRAKVSSGEAAEAEEEVQAKDSSNPKDAAAPSEDPKKTLKKLRKRLRQILSLETKQQNGEKINEDQLVKLSSKDSIESQICSLEKQT